MARKKKTAAWVILTGFLAMVLAGPVLAGERTVRFTVPGCV